MILNQALDDVAPDIYRDALEEAELEAFDQGQIEIDSDEPLVLRVNVSLVPKVDLGDVEALSIEPEILDALSLKHHLKRNAPPLLIVYGADDMPFITETCAALSAELQEAGNAVNCLAIPGTGHEFRGEDGYHEEHGTRAHAEMVSWFVRHLHAS